MLGLLAIGPVSGYELAKQMERSLRVIWRRAESRLYDEPRKLVAHGLARGVTERGGRRRTVYTITPAGRRALGRWLQEPSSPPSVEFEGLLKVLYADRCDVAALRATLDEIIDQARTRLAIGHALAAEYLEGRGPYPERVHVNALVWEYLRRQHEAMVDWASWARGVTAGWEDTQPTPAKHAGGLAIYRAGGASSVT